MIELLSPAGNLEKLITAIRFGANAVYFAGKKFGLRAFAGNFDENEIIRAVELCHKNNVKAYVTINILAHEDDFIGLDEYVLFLQKAGVDAVIVADIGIVSYIHNISPNMEIHISTQANVLNSYAINFFAGLGVKRIVLARELSIAEIKKIRQNIPKNIELEAFVHGAMCISYSGRCLLSNYLCGRDSNRGACIQACRFEYAISEKSRQGQFFPIGEDERGTYILNSKDLCLIEHIKELQGAGVTSFKIEGRMKSEYYVANVTNAYRRAIDCVDDIGLLKNELYKTSHRQYTTGFMFNDSEKECLESSMPVQTHEFMATVVQDSFDGWVKVEQRNRFKIGDTLEVLSPTTSFNKQIDVVEMKDGNGEIVEDAKRVQQIIFIKTNIELKCGDILRKKI